MTQPGHWQWVALAGVVSWHGLGHSRVALLAGESPDALIAWGVPILPLLCPLLPHPTPLRADHPSTGERGGSWHQPTPLPEEGWLETWGAAEASAEARAQVKRTEACGSLAKGPASWRGLRAHLPAGLTRPGVLEEL